METIIIETKKGKEVLDITDELNKVLSSYAVNNGICHLFLAHSTAGLATVCLSPEDELDIIDAFEVAVSHPLEPRQRYEHTHFKTRLPDHIVASFLGASLSVPFKNKKLFLGKLQRIALVELNGPRTREITVEINPESKNIKERGSKNEEKETQAYRLSKSERQKITSV